MKADRVILGKNAIFSTDCSVTNLNNNIIVCGTSGSGKTMSVTEPRLLETFNTSLICTVTKRRIVHKYKQMMAERGYEVLDLDFANCSEGNVGYDPLAYVKSSIDITHLAESIVIQSGKESFKSDPFWDRSAISLLSAEIGYVLRKVKDPTFADVLDFHEALKLNLMRDEARSTHDAAFARLEEEDPGCFAVSCWKTFITNPPRTIQCVYTALNTAIDKIFPPDIKELLRKGNRVRFADVAKKKTVLFVTTSPVNPSLQTLLNVFYGQAIKELFEFAEDQPRGVLPIPVHILCDDFATGGRILNFAEYISIFREKGISVTLLLQSESQLSSMYGADNATTIINNCDSYVYMGSNDQTTQRNVSIRADRPLSDIMYMPVGTVIIFRRGGKPVHTTWYNITEDERYIRINNAYEADVARRSGAANSVA